MCGGETIWLCGGESVGVTHFIHCNLNSFSAFLYSSSWVSCCPAFFPPPSPPPPPPPPTPPPPPPPPPDAAGLFALPTFGPTTYHRR